MKAFTLSTLLALAAAALAPGAVTTAKVTGGEVEGVVAGDVASFKGIPFAAPPVGDLRWKPPQPIRPWEGVKKADQFAPGPMQTQGMAAVMGVSSVSEDCLYLNVWTPASSPDARLPVMVWIYGGGFAGGGTSAPVFDGTRLAQKGVVVVSVAYRVGALGFLAHPELTLESGKGSGNYGLLDQIAGLKWVQKNIQAFGGDPDRVTIFGESAGAISVSMLAASPKAKGLFQGAISQSGGSFAPPKFADEGGQNLRPLKLAEAEGVQFIKSRGASDIAAARKLAAASLVGVDTWFWPTFDGDVLPGDQYELYQSGKFNDTAILIGTNSDEGALFPRPDVTPESFAAEVRKGYGARADRILEVYPHATAKEAIKAAKDLFRDSAFAWHTWAWAKLQNEKGKGQVFLYYFDHREPGSPDGANHAAELGYVFGNLVRPGRATRPEDQTLVELMTAYWTNFAKSGNPNAEGLPAWPPFTTQNPIVMQLDANPGPRPVPNLKQLQALDAYYAWRREEARKRK